MEHISIHALREESDFSLPMLPEPFQISIHALREESDLGVSRDVYRRIISIHALREESDFNLLKVLLLLFLFLSTLSVRRATLCGVL